MQLSDGTLRAWLDGELSPAEGQAIEGYLAADPEAQKRLAELQGRRERVSETLTCLAGGQEQIDTNEAWGTFQEQTRRHNELSAAAIRRRPRFLNPAWGALAASVLLAGVLLTSGSARAAAQRLLGFLRLRTVAVIPIDRGLLFDGLGNSRGKLFGELLSQSITEIKKPGEDATASSVAQASDLAGFQVRLPGLRTDQPVLKVKDNAAFQVKLDRARVSNFLDLTGRQDIELPASLDGATVAVDIPKSVQAAYGCPDSAAGRPDPSFNWANCNVLIQVPTPTVVTTPEFDVGMLAEVGLQVAGMSLQDARAIRNRIDWTSSLVIPIPTGDVSHEEVTVDGVKGVLVTQLTGSHGRTHPGYAVIWMKHGVTYALTGFGNGLLGLPIADSLQ